jgi:Protein of unknown function (DUF2889)
MPSSPLDSLPGYRRRFVITPQSDQVRCELEDDFHRMEVVIHHEAGIALKIDAYTLRAPWNTCPNAVAQVQKTFVGLPLDKFAARGEAKLNCTHLHDLAVLGATHAHDDAPLSYDVLVSDPVADRAQAELRRNGEPILKWTLQNMHIIEPAELAGTMLLEMRTLLASMDASTQEAMRILRWAAVVARGRIIPFEQQSNASTMPASCFTFQPGNKEHAFRIGQSKDFSTGQLQPLDARVIAAVKQDG